MSLRQQPDERTAKKRTRAVKMSRIMPETLRVRGRWPIRSSKVKIFDCVLKKKKVSESFPPVLGELGPARSTLKMMRMLKSETLTTLVFRDCGHANCQKIKEEAVH